MDRFVKGFFWFAFASFLAATIPHVAYFFRAFEPMVTGDTVWWIICYAIAVSIDATIYLLTITIVRLQRKKIKGSVILSVWVLVLFLTALSWYINLQYAQEFTSPMLSHASHLSLFGIEDINPFIASMFQVLVIVYTWIADKLTSSDSNETLEAKAKRLEDEKLFKDRIKAAKKGKFTAMVKGAIDSTSEIAGHVKHTIATKASIPSQNEQEIPLQPEKVLVDASESEAPLDSLQPQIEASKERVLTLVPEEVLQPEEVHTEALPVSSNGNGTVKNIDLEKFLQRSEKKR